MDVNTNTALAIHELVQLREKWLIAKKRYFNILTHQVEVKTALSNTGNHFIDVNPCPFCGEIKDCGNCDWGKVFGLCKSAGGKGNIHYNTMVNGVNLAIDYMNIVVKTISQRIKELDEAIQELKAME